MTYSSTPVVILAALASCVAWKAGAEEIQVANVLVKLIDELEVPAPEAGTLVEMAVREGSVVAEGDLLARVDDTQANYLHERARIELAMARDKVSGDVTVRSAERALQTAAAELRRAEDARARLREVITETELERLRLAADQAQLAVEKARQELALARLTSDLKQVEVNFAAAEVQRRKIRAPFAGVVVQINRIRGSWVEPGDRLLRLIRLDRLRVEGMMDARHYRPDLQGRPVRLVADLPGQKQAAYSGKLVFVSPEVDPFNKQVRILAEIENPNLTLQPGLNGTLAISPSAAAK